MARHDQLGGKMGPRIARVVSDAMADHLHRSAHKRADIGAQAALRFFETISAERDQHLAPLLGLTLGHPDTPPEAEQLLRFLHHGHGELAGLINMRTVGTSVAMGIGSGITGLLAPVNQRILQLHPNLTLDVQTAASAANAGLWSMGAAKTEAERQGINGERFDIARSLLIQYPDFTTAIELVRRGHAGPAEAREWLRRQGYTEQGAQLLVELIRQPLAPADAALMVLRGIIDESEGRAVGREAGYTDQDFDRLVLATGEPPGAEELMEALRRGFIDQQRFDHGIRQSRIRNEWIDVMGRLRFSPASTADAINAQIRGYIPESEARAISEQNGLEPGHFDFLLKGAGRPPGHMEMVQLQRRGLVSQAQVDQAVRESDIKDKYVGPVRGLYRHLLPERTVLQILGHGAITTEQALHDLADLGIDPADAKALVKAGTAQRTASHKHLAVGQVTALYEAHAIDKARAHQLIVALGYPETDVDMILSLAELKRHAAWRSQAIGAVRTAYLKHHVSEPEAQAELGALGVEQAEVAYLLRLWAIELRGQRRSLTEAQVIRAHKRGAFTDQQAEARLVGLGYDQADAQLLVELG